MEKKSAFSPGLDELMSLSDRVLYSSVPPLVSKCESLLKHRFHVGFIRHLTRFHDFHGGTQVNQEAHIILISGKCRPRIDENCVGQCGTETLAPFKLAVVPSYFDPRRFPCFRASAWRSFFFKSSFDTTPSPSASRALKASEQNSKTEEVTWLKGTEILETVENYFAQCHANLS